MELPAPAEPARENSDTGATSMDNSNSSAAKLESSSALAGQNQPPTNNQQINLGAQALDVSTLLQQSLNSSTTASSTPSILSTFAGLQNASQVQPQPTLSAAASAVVPLQFQSMPLQQAHQISQIPVAASSSLFPQQQQLQQLPLIQQLTATNAFAQASTGGQVQLAPQPPALNQLALLQQLASSTAALPKVEFGTLSTVTAPAQDNNPQLLQQLIHDNMVKNQTINALLLSQLHTQNAASVQMANSTNQNQMNVLLGNMSANLLASNSGTTVAGTTLAGQGQGTVPLPVAVESSSSSSSGSAYLYLPAQELQEKRWIQRYDELIQFQRIYGHCRVPHGYTANRKLSWWVMNQRSQRQLLKKGKRSWLTPDRISLLDAIEFDWNPTASKAKRSSKGKKQSGVPASALVS